MYNTRKLLPVAVALLLLFMTAVGLVACTEESNVTDETSTADTTPVTEPDSAFVTEPTTEPATEPDSASATEPATEPGTDSIKDQLQLEVNMSDLNPLMQPIFAGNSTVNETVMFLDKGDVKSLLYPIETIVSVTSYDGKTVYEEGKDYVVVDGQLQVTENSAIPCITRTKYYNSPGSLLMTAYNGTNVYTHWGEGRLMTDWQVNVNYTHTAAWEGYTQSSELEIYQNLVKKLQAGEDVTVFFYGDSITYGANASYISNYAPYQMSYPILFVQALADLFDYTVHYVDTGLVVPNVMTASKVPTEDYVAGTRGTITYVNTAIGGWTSADGVTNMDTFVKNEVSLHGCDLFVIGFGMNDGSISVRATTENVKKVVDAVLELEADASIVLVSTMVPNPNATNGWYAGQYRQEDKLLKQAETYREQGVACATACMTSVSLSVLERKDFHDYSGNNINHPNDYFVRIYAQTLLQTVIGYENMNEKV